MCAIYNQTWLLQQLYCAVTDIKSLNTDQYWPVYFHWFIQPLFYTCSHLKKHQNTEPHTFKLLSSLWTQFNDKEEKKTLWTLNERKKFFQSSKRNIYIFSEMSYAFLNINAYYIIFIKIFHCYKRPLTEENGQKHWRSI